MYLTDAQLSQVRTRPHRTRLWLSIFRPRVVLETQINQADIAKSDRDITVSVLSGTMLDVVGGMTVYIGSTQGAKDLGRIRLRSGSGTTLVLAENAINWIDGWFLTVVRYFEPWGVYPRIILDDNNNPVFYKDWDIAYTDQNETFDPVVCLGPNDAGMLNLDEINPTGSHRVWYTSSGTYDPTLGGTLSTFGWHFEGGSPTGSTAEHPGYVTYTGVGNYVTSLTVTTTDGASFTGRRHIRVMARPENAGSEKPANAWGLGNLSGDRDSGGWTGDIWMREPANPEDIVDGALVVIFSEDYEGGTEVAKIGANAENRGHIFFCGYILEDTIAWNPETSLLNFTLGGTSAKMAELSTLNVAIDDHKSTKITGQETHPWSRMPYTTVDRGLIHFLRWHSTLLGVTDISPTADGESRAISGVDIARGNIWDSVNQFTQSAVGATVVSDRQGKLWCEINANWTITGSAREIFGHMQNVLDVTKQDWRREIGFVRGGDDLAYLEMSGVAYSGAEATGSFDAYLSGAPGWAPGYHGGSSRIGNLALDGLAQDGLNQLAGNAWADANALYPSVTVPMAGDYRFIDIAPQQRVRLTVESGDTWRQIVLTDAPFIPDSISYEYRAADQILLMDMELREETHGGPGETIEIPVDPPYTGDVPDPWDIEFPPIIPPPIEPPIPPVPVPEENVYGYGVLTHVGGSGNRLLQTRNLESDPPVWAQISKTGVNPTGTLQASIGMFRLDPFDPTSIGYVIASDGIFYSTNLNATGSAAAEVTFIPTLGLEEMRTLVGEPTAFFTSNSDSTKGTIDVSQAKFGLLAALAFKLIGGSTYECYFLWSEYCFNGSDSWNFVKLEHDGSTTADEHSLNSGGGPTCIQLAWHPSDLGIVYISGFAKSDSSQNTLLWYGDFTIPSFLGDRYVPHAPFENIVAHSIYLPKKGARATGAHTLYGANQRTDPRIRVSLGSNGVDWDVLGDNPAIAFTSRPGNQTLQERMNATVEEIYAVGAMQDANETAITRYNPETEVFDIVAETTAANKPYYVTTGDSFFRGFGYFIWPFNEDVQWMSDGNNTAKFWETRDRWVTAREVGGNIFDDFGGGNQNLKFVQVCWLQVYQPGGAPID